MGLATAKVETTAGANVLLIGRDRNKLAKAMTELPQRPSGKVVDATVEKELRIFFGRSEPFDHLLLTVSGREGGGPFESLGVDTLKRAFDGKFWAQFMACPNGFDKTPQKWVNRLHYGSLGTHLDNPIY
jgi:NADP-dependent 3-hydroxy acid dehydrogenase YdfG